MKILNVLKKTLGLLKLNQLLKLGRIGKYSSFSILFILGTLLSVFMFKNYIGTDNTVVTDTEQIITMQKGDLVSDVTITGQI